MSRTREKSSFKANKTCSLAMPDEIQAHIDELKKDKKETHVSIILKSVKLLKNNIKEHAKRRVDLFFYLLISVYRKNVIVTKAETTKEHGKGSKANGTHACHSSLFPSISMQFSERGLRDNKKKQLTLSGTFLEESLNSTVELPEVVNGFDGHIEGRSKQSLVVQTCVNILNEVSAATIDPKQGMDKFFQNMHGFFNGSHDKYFAKSGKNTPSAAKKKVAKYEKEGTFFAASPNNTVRDEYVHLMLRLKPDEIKKTENNPDLSEYYIRVQGELESSRGVSNRP